MKGTSMVSRLNAEYVMRPALHSPVFIMLLSLAVLTFARALWVVVGFWSVLSLDARVIGICLLITVPGALVLTLRLRARILSKLSDNQDISLVSDIGNLLLMTPFFAYFPIYLALEIAFLSLRHK